MQEKSGRGNYPTAMNYNLSLLKWTVRQRGKIDKEMVNQKCQVSNINPAVVIYIPFVKAQQIREVDKQMVYQKRQISDTNTTVTVNIACRTDTAGCRSVIC